MPSKPKVEELFRKHLGEEVGNEILAKIEKMASAQAKPEEIEKAIAADIAAEIEKSIVSTVVAKIGPLTPIKVKPIQSDVKSIVSTKVSSAVNVKNAISPSMGVKVNVAPKTNVGPIKK
jgi:hypothetical protein